MAALVKSIMKFGTRKEDAVDCPHIEVNFSHIKSSIAQPQTCIIKTHLPYPFLPQCIEDGRGKVTVKPEMK